jgi:hypothetical protein
MATIINPNGINMASYSQRNLIEDFLKAEYEGVLRDEFNKMEALINRLPKDTITGKKKYKTFRLGISDNVRMLGNSFDNYELSVSDFYNSGTERVEAEFDTTKLLATFAITDEAILKGTSDGSIVDVLKESLDAMELALKTTFQRFTYGTEDGWIGEIKRNATTNKTGIEIFSIASHTVTGARPKYDAPDNNFYDESQVPDSALNQASGNRHSVPSVIKFKMTNSAAMLPGMGLIVVKEVTTTATGAVTKTALFTGKIWQMDNSVMDVNGDANIIFFVDKVWKKSGTSPNFTYSLEAPTSTLITAAIAEADAAADSGTTVKIKTYARQFSEQVNININKEYVGLQDIVIDVDKKIYGVDRSVYTSLKSTVMDLNNQDYMGEEYLRDMADHLSTTMPDNTAITLVAAKHRIISAVEKSMYQFKEYSMDTTGNGYQLGRPDIKFDNFVLVKDKFARDQNVYFLDQNKIGELVRRDLQWITSGEVNGVLQRRDGTELYEGIMNKYANTYIDAWRCHAAFVNVAVPGIGTAVGTKYAAISSS